MTAINTTAMRQAALKYVELDDHEQLEQSDPTRVALVPAGGELWEDFLDSIGVSLEQFCREGPGGWILGYIEALASVDIRTVLVFYSARVAGVRRFINTLDGSMITVIPVDPAYVRKRARYPIYREMLAAKAPPGLAGRAGQVLGAISSHRSTPIRATLAVLRTLNCRAIICQEYEYFRFDACLLLGRLLAVPVFATFQGSTHEPNVLSRLWKAALVRRAAALIIPAAEEVARVRSRYGARTNIVQIPNPLNLTTWNAADRAVARQQFGISPDARLVVWHGRIAVYAKALDLLIEAWRKLCGVRPGKNLALLLVGTGEDADAFGRLLDQADTQGVTWLNQYVTDRSVIRQMLSAGDVYAFPSRLEGFPVAPLEAMACGLPVVAAGSSGTHEIIGEEQDAGFLVPPDDQDAFAEALGRLIDDPHLTRQMGQAARKRVEDVFSVEVVGRQLAQLLQQHAVQVPHR
jgi:starch synthase